MLDIYRKLLISLPTRDTCSFAASCKTIHSICNEEFWRDKLALRVESCFKEPYSTWLERYKLYYRSGCPVLYTNIQLEGNCGARTIFDTCKHTVQAVCFEKKGKFMACFLDIHGQCTVANYCTKYLFLINVYDIRASGNGLFVRVQGEVLIYQVNPNKSKIKLTYTVPVDDSSTIVSVVGTNSYYRMYLSTSQDTMEITTEYQHSKQQRIYHEPVLAWIEGRVSRVFLDSEGLCWSKSTEVIQLSSMQFTQIALLQIYSSGMGYEETVIGLTREGNLFFHTNTREGWKYKHIPETVLSLSQEGKFSAEAMTVSGAVYKIIANLAILTARRYERSISTNEENLCFTIQYTLE